ncbi:MAG: carbamoyl-phosphate synthase large subunit, partial [Desulfobaccales bacterium]
GILEKYGVEMIGAKPDVIKKAEDRELFRDAMANINLRVPKSAIVRTLEEAVAAAPALGYPVIVRPSFTLGGTGGGIAYNLEDLKLMAAEGLDASMITEVMLEESVLGWKEFELEVMRDFQDNVVIICSIENLDPMGVHTGDSITVAPAQTLTDREYQAMRDAAIAIIREIGVETGGSNIQFAIHPETGEMVIIEMNPRVSRSSALASKATGFPIAKIAAKLAVGFTLDEIHNDITRETLASFEPSIDYCVVKIPRWAFEKFPGAEDFLTTAMKSVGEVMAIGRTFKEALQKGIRSLEIGRFGLGHDGKDLPEIGPDELRTKLRVPNSQRLFYLRQAFRGGMSVKEVYDFTMIDPWFLHQIQDLVAFSDELALFGELLRQGRGQDQLEDMLRRAKEYGFSDVQLGHLWGGGEEKIAQLRRERGVTPVYKLVDTCAAEFEAYTPYFYSTYEWEDEARKTEGPKVAILGGGPNRIGQGIEFDYCCCQASFALRELGVESIMVNSNPETVSTDYDTSDKLYFEPLTREDVLNIVATENPKGLILQFGGQTPLNLAVPLGKAGVRIMGTSATAIDRAEDRKLFKQLLAKLKLKQPPNDTATSVEQALEIAHEITYPVLVRPSYVLGGRAMQIVADDAGLVNFMNWALEASPDHPILIDKFLEDAIEVDVDAICDGRQTVIGGIMEHIEEAGIHSGDSACVLPPYSLSREIQAEIKAQTRAMAAELGVIGLINIQFAVKNNEVYVLEVNPRASRTVPFVSKATGVSLAKLATKVMLGHSLEELGFTKEIEPPYFAVKESVFPFRRFPGVDPLLGPEMRSTGEVMGIDADFGFAFAKSQLAAG